MDSWPDLLPRYSQYLAAAGAAAGTIRLRLRYLRWLAARTPSNPCTLTLDDLVAFIGRPGWAPETRHSARSAVRGFYRWLRLSGRITVDPSELLPAVKIPPTQPRPVPDEVLMGAFARAACPRDRLMVLIATCTGLRRAEIAALHSDAISGDTMRVRGKGGRVRTLPLHPALAEVLDQRPRGYVFPGMVDGHLSPDRVGRILSDLLGPGYSGHTVRHRFASRAFQAERDILAVSRLLGHAKIETSVRYTAIPDGALLAGVMAAGLPFAALAVQASTA